ncbi:MAG: radical SAM protein [archaeon GW2011_AR17]|nr:MAG: radical SAM protein [archaeon GW2011_AR17]
MDDIPFKIYSSTFEKKFKIYAKNLTPKRMLNYTKVQMSLKAKSPKVWGKPLSLFIEPTNICNLKCPLCPTGNNSTPKGKGYMKFEDYTKIIDELGPTAFSVTLWNYGEPSLNKDFIRMIRYAKEAGLKVITSTNGFIFRNKEQVQELLESGLDELILAVDGASKESYDKYRINGHFEELIQGIKDLAVAKKAQGRYFPYLRWLRNIFLLIKNIHDTLQMRVLHVKHQFVLVVMAYGLE